MVKNNDSNMKLKKILGIFKNNLDFIDKSRKKVKGEINEGRVKM